MAGGPNIPPPARTLAQADGPPSAERPMADNLRSALWHVRGGLDVDPADIVRFQQWRYDACVALTTPPYTLTPTPLSLLITSGFFKAFES